MATTLESLCEALGWQGGTIHEALAEVRRLKAYREQAHEALYRAGKLSIMADSVVRSDVLSLSPRLAKLSEAVQEYDRYVIEWTIEGRTS